MGFVHEALGYHRNKMIKDLAWKSATIGDRLKICGSYVLSVFLSYSLMLCIMSYNVGVFFTVIISLSLWNSVFNFYTKKNTTIRSLASENAYAMIAGEGDVKCCDDAEPGVGATNLEDLTSPNISNRIK